MSRRLSNAPPLEIKWVGPRKTKNGGLEMEQNFELFCKNNKAKMMSKDFSRVNRM